MLGGTECALVTRLAKPKVVSSSAAPRDFTPNITRSPCFYHASHTHSMTALQGDSSTVFHKLLLQILSSFGSIR